MLNDLGYLDTAAGRNGAATAATRRHPSLRPLRHIAIIGSASGLGAPDQRCAAGPEALRRFGLIRSLNDDQHCALWWDTVRPAVPAANPDHITAIQDICQALAERVAAALEAGERFGVIGGDHSCAIGTWSGAHSVLNRQGRLGLLWIDAHMDSHTPATSPSGAVHGMPLAVLLGRGDPVLTQLMSPQTKLHAEQVVLLGVRSFEEEEARLLRDLGVRVMDMAEVRGRGLDSAFTEAVTIISRGTAGFGISIDLDALDPAQAPGVGTPVPSGLDGGELADCLAQIAHHPDLLGIELAELNPARDRDHRTTRLARDLLRAGLTGRVIAHPPRLWKQAS
jgi:arginase